MLRKLRIAFSVLCGILCFLLIALWVRSYWWYDDVIGHLSGTRLVGFSSMTGTLGFDTSVWPSLPPLYLDYVPWRVNSFAMDEECNTWFASPDYRESLWRLQYTPPPNQDLTVIVPHWFAIRLSAVFTAIPWIHWSKRFSLRTLLIATTVIATVLGALAFNSTRRTAQPPVDVGDFGSPD